MGMWQINLPSMHLKQMQNRIISSKIDNKHNHFTKIICIFVEKYNRDSADYYEFETVPVNNSVLWFYETVFPRKILYPYKYKSCLFLFSFTDEKIGISHCIDTIQIDIGDWVKYLYIEDENNPELMLPLRAVEIYAADTYTLYSRYKCADVSSKKRIINTIHMKLFL